MRGVNGSVLGGRTQEELVERTVGLREPSRACSRSPEQPGCPFEGLIYWKG